MVGGCGTKPLELSAPYNVAAVPGPGRVELSWQDDNENEDGFAIYRAQQDPENGASDFVYLAETAQDVLEYEDSDTEPDEAYAYRVSATANGAESASAETSYVRPRPKTLALTLLWRGAGGGTVTSDPEGVRCSPQQGACTFDIATDTALVLRAQPNASSVFVGWAGDCSGTESCELVMDGDKRIEVTFEQATRRLSVAKAGDGAGTVRSTNFSDFVCGPNCPDLEQAFVLGNAVALEAVAEAGSAFRGWSGDCAGASCQVTLDQNRSVTATFEKVAAPDIVSFRASETTVLRGEPVQLSWEVTPERDTRLSLAAGDAASDVTGSSSLFVEPGATTTYTLTASNTSGRDEAALTVTVTPAFVLEVAVLGNPDGKVVGTGGINCGTVCVKIYEEGSEVTLNADSSGASFESWGAGSGCAPLTAPSCTVTMNADRTVTARFAD